MKIISKIESSSEFRNFCETVLKSRYYASHWVLLENGIISFIVDGYLYTNDIFEYGNIISIQLSPELNDFELKRIQQAFQKYLIIK